MEIKQTWVCLLVQGRGMVGDEEVGGKFDLYMVTLGLPLRYMQVVD